MLICFWSRRLHFQWESSEKLICELGGLGPFRCIRAGCIVRFRWLASWAYMLIALTSGTASKFSPTQFGRAIDSRTRAPGSTQLNNSWSAGSGFLKPKTIILRFDTPTDQREQAFGQSFKAINRSEGKNLNNDLWSLFKLRNTIFLYYIGKLISLSEKYR